MLCYVLVVRTRACGPSENERVCVRMLRSVCVLIDAAIFAVLGARIDGHFHLMGVCVFDICCMEFDVTLSLHSMGM